MVHMSFHRIKKITIKRHTQGDPFTHVIKLTIEDEDGINIIHIFSDKEIIFEEVQK